MSITAKSKGRAGALVLITLASVGISAVGVTVAAGPAQARCVESPQSVNISIGGVVVGREEAQSQETCVANNVYYGRIKDTRTDGSCLRVRYKDAGVWNTQATSCDSAGVNYTFWDRDGDYYSNLYGQLSATGAQSGAYINVGY